MYKQASQLKLRIPTSVGLLSVEQLWDLNRSQLEAAIRTLRSTIKRTEEEDGELSFLDLTYRQADVVKTLQFDILKDIYITKKKEAEDKRNAKEIKEHNAKIDALIAEKKEGKLREMSIEELEKLYK